MTGDEKGGVGWIGKQDIAWGILDWILFLQSQSTCWRDRAGSI